MVCCLALYRLSNITAITTNTAANTTATTAIGSLN